MGISTPIRVRFIGASGQFNSVATQAVRVHNGIASLGDSRVKSEVMLLPAETFRPGRIETLFRRGGRKQQLAQLVEDTDILVIVKSALFPGFRDVSSELRSICHENGIVLVSSPADGPESTALGRLDLFSEQQADYVLTISKMQHQLLSERRGEETVRYVGSSTRPSAGAKLEVRDKVRTVVWENPPHHDPFARPELNGTPRAEHEAFERFVTELCLGHDARLVTFGFWRDQQDDTEWENTLLAADVAIECKALRKQHTSYQLQKPPVKLENYLALGMPVVCDSLPGHVDSGTPAGVLFADTLEEWAASLGKLFESRDLRARMSHAARESVISSSIAAVAKRYVDNFVEMAGVSTE